MVVEELAVLAAAGGKALVAAMVTDGWEGIKKRFARLLGRGDKEETEAAAGRLEKARGSVARLSGAELKKAQAEQEVAWRTRLADLLENAPDAADELRVMVDEMRAKVIGSADLVGQRVAAFDQAQVANQGHGIQTNFFGGQGESAADR
jgi:hypothetical protein